MSSKVSKSATADNKSKTKAVLLMLEKVMSSVNPDKEQIRFLCQKLLHMANTHESARKELSSKNGMEIVLTILETCGDQTTCLALVNILSEIAAGTGLKRLVNHDVTRVLLHTVAYLGKEADNRLLAALIGLSVKIAPKDRRFALRVRLAGALPVLVSIVRSSPQSTSNKLLSTSLQCLKICAANGVNASVLGRLGAVNVLQRLIISLGRKQPSITKTTLSTLSLLVKSSRSNANHAITNGVVTNMLTIYQEWHKYDHRGHKHMPARKSMLNILKHLTVSKKGRGAFIDAAGMRILHRTCKECSMLACAKAAEPLLSVATLILRRCQPRFRLPIPTVQCTFQFALPQTVEKTTIDIHVPTASSTFVDDVIDVSDDEDDDEAASDIQELENQELFEEQRMDEEMKATPSPAAPFVIPPLDAGIPLKRAATELKLTYAKFFPEVFELWNGDGDCPTAPESFDSTFYLQPHLLRRFEQPPQETTTLFDSTQQSMYFLRGGEHHIHRTKSDGNVLGTCGKFSHYRHPSTAPAPSIMKGDEHSLLMASLASSTVSQKQNINTISLADYFGHIPPAYSEAQVPKKYGVQRIKMLEDIARSLKQGDLINKVVYSRDGDYRPPKSLEFGLYQVESSEGNLDVLREVLRSSLDDGMASAVLQDPDSLQEATPVITEAFDFDSLTVSNDAAASFGYKESVSNGPRPPLNFRSDFECGNLRTAIQVRQHEYDLILDADCNTTHHHQWFYFEVSRISSGVPIRFNIVNCEKNTSQFNSGMQPLMYSVSEARLSNPSWHRVGTNICYYKSHFSRSAASASGVKGKSFFTMTFTVTFPYDDDICYFAYHYPYTYTQLNADLHRLVGQVDEKQVYVRVQTLCYTMGGNPVPVLTITAQPEADSEGDVEVCSRPYIFLSARVHPGESNSSWTMSGTLKLLLSSGSSEKKMADIATQLRKRYIFKVIPMLNPDGVINGHHRCSLSGEDLNRQWIDPDPSLFPTIYHSKGLLQYLKSIGKGPLVYCDYHGHSRRKNVFMYGCSRKESVLAGESDALTGAPDDTGFKTLPKLLNRMAPAFSMSNCSFVVEKCKESTARVVVWKEIGVARSYTMESTYCGCDQGRYKGFQIGTQELEEMGMTLCEAMLQLKSKDRARRYLNDKEAISDENLCNSYSDLSLSDHPSVDSETRSKMADWDGVAELSESYSDLAAPCPTNSDEELTPDEADSMGGYAVMENIDADDPLITQYSREFWDYNEYCRRFGLVTDDGDDTRVTPRPEESAETSERNGFRHTVNRDEFGLQSSYRIATDSGEVLFDDNDDSDLMLSAIMERNSLREGSNSTNF